MGLLDSVIGGVLGQVLGGGRGQSGGGAMSPIVKALLMLLLAKGAGGGLGGGGLGGALGDILGGGHRRQPEPGPDTERSGSAGPYGRDSGDVGGFNPRGDRRDVPAPLPGGNYSDLSGMLDGPGGAGQGAGQGGASYASRESGEGGDAPDLGGLDGLVERFRQGGMGDMIDSWIGHGPNRAVAPDELGRALGPGALDTLQSETGLEREDLLGQLAQVLPEVVSKLTPQGRVPDAGERHGW